MKCSEIFEKLSEYVDKELDAAEHKKIDSHMAGCPICLAFLGTLKKTMEIFQSKRSTKIPDELSKNLRTQIQGEIGKSPQ